MAEDLTRSSFLFYLCLLMIYFYDWKAGYYTYYTVEFDDDAPEGMEVPQRQVKFTHVVQANSGFVKSKKARNE